MSPLDRFTGAYIEALYFTETGDEGQPDSDAELTPLSRANALNACARFYATFNAKFQGDIEQAGHDFWFTRNRHGTGFWDRPELYGF